MLESKRFRISWRTKAAAFHFFDKVPYGDQLYYLFQKHVTKSHPRRMSPLSETARLQSAHMDAVARSLGDLGKLTILEIGAGWDLFANMIYWCRGVDRQYAIDVSALSKAALVNDVIRHFQRDLPPGARREPQVLLSDEDFRGQLERYYGITYLAPYDATRLDLPDGSIDAILSTSVFEHIPEAIIRDMLPQFLRVLKPRGLMRHTIDYTDHYAHSDKTISRHNMMRFSERAWRLYNPGNHFQNRLRTADFEAMFRAAGFVTETVEPVFGSAEEAARNPFDAAFADMSETDRMTLYATFTLRPASRV